MADVFNVTASYDKPSYVGGDTITITISGDDVVTETTQSMIGPLVIPLVNPSNGSTSIINVPSEIATVTTTTSESVVIDTSQPIVDSSATPRVWTVSGNKLFITSIA
jgi:hypothetical protein